MGKKYDLLVVGAGPAGLMAAITAAENGAETILLERKDVPCKKLYATGNGRCNFTNLKMEEGVYRGGGSRLAEELTDEFDRNDLLHFMQSRGLMTKHIGDYVYPYNEQAGAVAALLLSECRRLGVRIICSAQVGDIKKSDKGGFEVFVSENKTVYEAGNVLIAVGGKASPAHGSDGNLNRVIRSLGHKIIPQEPALVPLLFADKSLSEMAGVRVKCGVLLNCHTKDGQRCYRERGEIIFNRDNISGIPVMQLSRFAVMCLKEGGRATLELDLFPDETAGEVSEFLARAFTGCGDPHRSSLEALSLCLHDKLASYILKVKCSGSEPEKAIKWEKQQTDRLADLLKHFRIKLCGNAGFSRAQVTAGGVSADEVSSRLESRIIPGLFFAGEILDVDGTCGGYNLHWAFASGRKVGESVKR